MQVFVFEHKSYYNSHFMQDAHFARIRYNNEKFVKLLLVILKTFTLVSLDYVGDIDNRPVLPNLQVCAKI